MRMPRVWRKLSMAGGVLVMALAGCSGDGPADQGVSQEPEVTVRNMSLPSTGLRESANAGLETVRQCFDEVMGLQDELRNVVPSEPLPVEKIWITRGEIRPYRETQPRPDAVSELAKKCIEMRSAIIEDNRNFTERQPSPDEDRVPADESPSRDESRVPADESPSRDKSRVPADESPSRDDSGELQPPFVQPTVTALSIGSLPGSGTYSDPFVIAEHMTVRDSLEIEWKISDPDDLVADLGYWGRILDPWTEVGSLVCNFNDAMDVPQQGTFTQSCGPYGPAWLSPGDYVLSLPLLGQFVEEEWYQPVAPVEYPWADTWLRVIPAVQPVIQPVYFGGMSGSGTEESPFQIPATEATESHLYDLHWAISDPDLVVGGLYGGASGLWKSLGDESYDLTPMWLSCKDGKSIGSSIINESCSFHVLALTPGIYLGDFRAQGVTLDEGWAGQVAITNQPSGTVWFEVTGPSNLTNLKTELATNPLITALEYGELSGSGTTSDPFFLPAEKANWDWPRDITWQITDPDDTIGFLSSTAKVHTVSDYGLAHNQGTYAKCDIPSSPDTSTFLSNNPPASGEIITAACKVFLEQGLHLFAFSLQSNTFNTPLYGDSHESLLSAAKFWVLVG